MAMAMAVLLLAMLMLTILMSRVDAGNTNGVYQPCADTKIQRSDGFTFGIAFSSKDSFYYNQNQSHQLSPCDRRLSLASLNSQLALFRPKVDDISLLTINTSSFSPVTVCNPTHYSLALWLLTFLSNASNVATCTHFILKKQKLKNGVAF